MTLSLSVVLLLAAIVLAVFLPVLRLVLSALLLIVPIILLVLFLLDLAHGAPDTIRFVTWLIAAATVVVNGILTL